MDQTALKNQVLFRHQRQCSEDPDLDCCLDLFAGCNCPQAFGTAGEPLPNSTDSQCHAFRESAHFTGSGSTIFPGRLTRRPQPIDSVQLLTGHYWNEVNARGWLQSRSSTRLLTPKLGSSLRFPEVFMYPQSELMVASRGSLFFVKSVPY